jgi:hypothetical protein
MLVFGFIQFYLVYTGHNPTIAISENSGAFIDSDNVLDASKDHDFFMAFSIQHTITKKLLYDEKLVRFVGLISEGDGVE